MFLNVFKCSSSHKNAKQNAKYATYEWEKQPFQKNCKMTRNAKKQNAEKMHCRIWPRWHSQSLACEPKTDLFFVQMLTQPLRLFFRNRFVLRSFFFEQQSILLLSCFPEDENWQCCCCCCSGILESDMCPLHCTEILRMSYISLIFSFVDRTGSINNFQSCTML